MTAARSSSIWCNQGINHISICLCLLPRLLYVVTCLLQWSNVSKVYNDDDTTHASKCVSQQYLGIYVIHVVGTKYGYRTVCAIKYCLNSRTQTIHLNYIPHFSLTSLILISVNHMQFLQWLVFLHRFYPSSTSALYQLTPYCLLYGNPWCSTSRITDRRSSHGFMNARV